MLLLLLSLTFSTPDAQTKHCVNIGSHAYTAMKMRQDGHSLADIRENLSSMTKQQQFELSKLIDKAYSFRIFDELEYKTHIIKLFAFEQVAECMKK